MNSLNKETECFGEKKKNLNFLLLLVFQLLSHSLHVSYLYPKRQVLRMHTHMYVYNIPYTNKPEHDDSPHEQRLMSGLFWFVEKGVLTSIMVTRKRSLVF